MPESPPEPSHPDVLRLVDGYVDLVRRTAVVGGEVRRLTTTEAGLLARLAREHGRPVSRESLLVDVWGYSPQSLSRTIDVAVRRLRAKIEPDPHDPVHLLSVHGVGYAFVPAGPPSTATAPLPAEPPAEPPPVEPETVGREDELSSVQDELAAGARPLTLAGAAGVGKTHLARVLVARARKAGQAAWLVDLVSARTAADLAMVTAAALGLDRSDEATVGAALQRGQGLLVLDNFEQLPADAAQVVAAWLARAPDARVVVTSRRSLGLPGERVVRLPPLGLDDAVALFQQRAAAVRPDAALGDQAILRALVARLDGLPLSLELAAARLRALSLPELAERMALPLLRDATGARPDRATLAQALDASWALLTEDGRRALVDLSRLPGPCFAAVALAVLDRLEHPDGLLAIEELVDLSLFRIVEGPPEAGASRLVPFVCVVEHAALREPGPADPRWIEALAEVLEGWARQLDGPDARRARARLLAEADLVLAALRQPGAPAARLRAVEAWMQAAVQVGGHPADLPMLDLVVPLAAELGDRAAQARLLARRIFVADRVGQTERAQRDATRLRELCAGDPSLDDARIQGEVGRASALRRAERAVEALAVLQALELPPGLPGATVALVESERGLALTRLGRLSEAAVHIERALHAAEDAGDAQRADAALAQLALIRVEEGRAAEVEDRVRQALARERRGAPTLLLWQYVLGVVALEAGRLDEARQAFAVEMETGRAMQRPSTVASGLVNLALVELRADRPAAAAELLEQAYDAFLALRAESPPAVVGAALDLALLGCGRPSTARPRAEARTPLDQAMLDLAEAARAWSRDPASGRPALAEAVQAGRAAATVDLRELARYASRLLQRS